MPDHGTALKGVVHGRVIELDQELGLPDGETVTVTVQYAKVVVPEEIPEDIPRAELWLDRLVFDSSVLPGERIVKGTKLAAESLVAEIEQSASDQGLLQAHPGLTPEDVQALRVLRRAGLDPAHGGGLGQGRGRAGRVSRMDSPAADDRPPGDRRVSFLLDTDISSAYLKGNGPVTNRFVQYGGRLNISTVTLGELFAWALRAKAAPRRLQQVHGLLNDVRVLPVDETVARKFGEVRAWQLDRGLATSRSGPDQRLRRPSFTG